MNILHKCKESEGEEPSFIGTELLTYNVELFNEEKNAHFSNSDNCVTSIVCQHCGEDVLEEVEEADWEISFN